MDRRLRPVTLYCTGENIYFQIPNSISANNLGWLYECDCTNLRWAYVIMSRVFLRIGSVKIPPVMIESPEPVLSKILSEPMVYSVAESYLETADNGEHFL